MLDFHKIYKQSGFGLQNPLINQKALRIQRLNDQRRNRRSELFSASRGNQQGNAQEPFKKQEVKKVDEDRLQTLAKWREERNRRKLLEKSQSKPPFKVGVVRHRWYSPPVIKDELMKNKQKREIMRNKKFKVIQNVPLSSMGNQFQAPTTSDAISSAISKRIAKKRIKRKKYPQNIYDGSITPFLSEEFDTSTPGSIISCLSEEFDTSTPIQTEIISINKGISPEQQEEECTTQYCKYLLNEETEYLIRLCLEDTENKALRRRDMYHLIEDCHAQFKKLEELEANN